MKKSLKLVIAFLAGLVLFCSVLTKVGWQNLTKAGVLLLNWQGLAMVGLTFVTGVVSIFRWRLIFKGFKSQGKNFDFGALARIWAVGYATSYITPMAFLGGEPLRAYLVKKKLGLNWQESIASVAIDKLLDATLFLSATVLGILVFLLFGPIPSEAMIWVAIGVVILLGGAITFFYFKAWRKQSALRFILKWIGLKERLDGTKNGKTMFQIDETVVRFFSPQHRYFWQGLGLSFIKYSLLVLKATFVIYFLEKVLSPAKGLAAYAFSSLAILLPFPAGLGSMEVLEGLIFKGLGFSFASGTVFGMVYRGVELAMVAVGLVFLAKFGLDLLQTKIIGSTGSGRGPTSS